MTIRASVGHRLWLLVGCQTAITALFVIYAMSRVADGRLWLLTMGGAGTALVLFLGLHVRQAIAPRIQRLVSDVRTFQEFGVHERIGDMGKDDIAVLANAIDAGFAAIAARDRERAQFLAIAAHELKTPITSIRGYASLLLQHREEVSDPSRALQIINRQAWRLSRLIESVFLAVRARNGTLGFDPEPIDLSTLVRRVLREMEPLVHTKAFVSYIQDNIAVLGDEALLEHALWSLFTCAAALSPEDRPVTVSLMVGHSAELSVDIARTDAHIPEVQELFLPFHSVEYENGLGTRGTIGLYLCREVVRVHNGELHVRQASDEHSEFVVELPV